MYACVQFFFFLSLYGVKNECVQNNPEGVREVVAEENISTKER